MERTRAGHAERLRGQASAPLPGWLLHAPLPGSQREEINAPPRAENIEMC